MSTARSSGPSRASRAALAAHRGARRRAETRARLVEAARVLMATKGVHATSIQEITDAADLGFGTFFNHFPSKEALAEAVLEETVEAFASSGESLAATLTDPAERLAAGIRHTVQRAENDPAFGRFLARTALAGTERLRTGLARRLAYDIEDGIAKHRLHVPDPLVATIAAGGAVLACIVARLNRELGADAAERTAAAVLQMVGVPAKEAARLARRPLPALGDDEPARPLRRATKRPIKETQP